jgi:hypothetical protein
MEDVLASMKDSLDRVDRRMPAAPAADSDPTLKASPDVARAPPPPAAAPAAAPAMQAAPAPKARPAAEPSRWHDGLLFGLLAAAVAGTLLWLRGRSQRRALPESADLDQPTEPQAARSHLSEVDFPLDADAPLPRPRQLTERQAVPTQPAPDLAEDHSIDVAEHESAMELAEIMLSFGRIHGAAQTLADYIEANPRHSVEPWLRLLEIYHGAGMRAEFEALARHLNQTFNIEVLAWEGKGRDLYPDDLESYPHIMDGVQAGWGTAKCLDYLQHLMRDNRNGTRDGFPVAVLYDILLLIGVLEERLGPQALQPAAQ